MPMITGYLTLLAPWEALKVTAPGSHVEGQNKSLILLGFLKFKKIRLVDLSPPGSFVSIFHLALEMRKSMFNTKMLVQFPISLGQSVPLDIEH